MYNYLISIIAAYGIVYFMIPPLKRLALKIGFVDRPNKRKIHKEPIPQMASIAIYIGFMVVYFLCVDKLDNKTLGISIGSLLILSIGLVDDWYKVNGKDFPAMPKMIVQILAAIIVYKAGVVFLGFHNPLTNTDVVFPGWLQLIFSVTWIFGVTTVINFSDGMDGVAGALTAISAATLFFVAVAKNQQYSAIMASTLLGTALGYLKYNKPPAKIFMGDSGATFMGFILGIIALDGAFKQATAISLLIPILALGVPIFDNIYVIIKRYINGVPIYKADRRQIHYRLSSSGLNNKQVLAALCLFSSCLGMLSIILLLLKV